MHQNFKTRNTHLERWWPLIEVAYNVQTTALIISKQDFEGCCENRLMSVISTIYRIPPQPPPHTHDTIISATFDIFLQTWIMNHEPLSIQFLDA
jgi:hypothetical protein